MASYSYVIQTCEDCLNRLETELYAPLKASMGEYQELLDRGQALLTEMKGGRTNQQDKSSVKKEATATKNDTGEALDRQYSRLSAIVKLSLKGTQLKTKLGLGPVPTTVREKREVYRKLAENLETLTEGQAAMLLANGWSQQDGTFFIDQYAAYEQKCTGQQTGKDTLTLETAKVINLKPDLEQWYRTLRKTAQGLIGRFPHVADLVETAFPALQASSSGSGQNGEPPVPPDGSENPDPDPDPQEPGNGNTQQPGNGGQQPGQGNGQATPQGLTEQVPAGEPETEATPENRRVA